MEKFPALNTECFDQHIAERLHLQEPPRILILYGSVRERSYSRFVAEEAGRLLTAMGAEVKFFNPSGLPLPDDAPATHPNVNALRGLVRGWDQSSVAKAWQEFDENGRMKPSSWYDRIVDVAEELFKTTLLLKGQNGYLVDRYSERKESHKALSERVNQAKI